MPQERKRSIRIAAVLAVLAGLLAMHALTSPLAMDHAESQLPLAHTAMAQMPATPMIAANAAAAGLQANGPQPLPHHAPFASAHHPCAAALVGSVVVLVTPAANLLAEQPVPSGAANATRPAGAGSGRAPPDLDKLCVSRT